MKKLTIDGFAPVLPSASLGPATLLQWIPVSLLVVDPSYQREISTSGRKNVRSIASQFSWTHFAPLMVSPIEGGHYAIIDGQHRATAAMLIGIEQVPCAVVIADRVTQAAAFHAVNARVTKLHTVQIFHARIVAGDARAIAAQAVCERAGVRVVKSAGGWQAKPQNTMAVEVIENAAAKNADAAVLTLRLIREANELECYVRNYLRSHMIDALFGIIADRREWLDNEQQLAAAFEEIDLDAMWTIAQINTAQIKGTTIRDQLQAALIEELELWFGRLAA